MSLESPNSTAWYVYLVRTASNSLYCGITTNVERRFAEHCTGRGAKALKGKGPLSLVWKNDAGNSRSCASKIEYKIKQLSKVKKERLVSGDLTLNNVIDVTPID